MYYSSGVCMMYVVSVFVLLVSTDVICQRQEPDMSFKPFCGLSGDQIASFLASPKTGVAVRQECFGDNKIGDLDCIKEQTALVECLKNLELYLANEDENEIYSAHPELVNEQYNINETFINDNVQDEDEATKLLEEMTTDFMLVYSQYKSTLDKMEKLSKLVYDLNMELDEVKSQFTTALEQHLQYFNLSKSSAIRNF